ncbi:MAG: hypothetical protein U0232_13820 [Thermomicrobiales bacterium]
MTGGDRLFVSQDLTSTIIEVDPQADYAVKGVWPISGPDGVIRASADGSRLYVSTDAGIDII